MPNMQVRISYVVFAIHIISLHRGNISIDSRSQTDLLTCVETVHRNLGEVAFSCRMRVLGVQTHCVRKRKWCWI